MNGWTKTASGYELTSHGAMLTKVGARWTLALADGRTFDLGRKASFDHAERAIAQAAH